MALLPRSRALQVPALLDEYGRPLRETPTRSAIAKNPRGMQTYNTHPAVGLTVENLLSFYAQAERGSPTKMMDMFDDLIQRHADCRGMLLDRNDDVSGSEWSIVPPEGRVDKPSVLAAAALQERMKDNCGFLDYLTHMLTAVPFGYACTNMEWNYVEDVIVPVEFCFPAQRRFAAPRDRIDEIMLVDGDSFGLIPLEPGLWSCAKLLYRNPWVSGLMTSCAWWILFGLTNFKGWLMFSEMFGMPLAIGYYEEGASGPSRNELENAVKTIGQDGFAILSSLTELVIKEAARGGDSSTVYPEILRVCDTQLAKLITGGTLNTDVSSTGAGSYNAATVHANRSYKAKRRDARTLETAFSETIGRSFVAWNGYDRAAPPRLKMKIARDELQRAQTLEILGQAVPLSKAQIQEEFNLRPPGSSDDEVTFQITPPPEPGHAREEKKR